MKPSSFCLALPCGMCFLFLIWCENRTMGFTEKHIPALNKEQLLVPAGNFLHHSFILKHSSLKEFLCGCRAHYKPQQGQTCACVCVHNEHTHSTSKARLAWIWASPCSWFPIAYRRFGTTPRERRSREISSSSSAKDLRRRSEPCLDCSQHEKQHVSSAGEGVY